MVDVLRGDVDGTPVTDAMAQAASVDAASAVVGRIGMEGVGVVEKTLFDEAESVRASQICFPCPYLSRIKGHLEQTIGPVTSVVEEASGDLRIDLLVIPSTACSTVVTAGLSTFPMNVPYGRSGSALAELMVSVPGDWVGGAARSWPVRWLRTIARQPSLDHSFVGRGCLIPNEVAGQAFAEDTKLSWILIMPSALFPKATTLQLADRIAMRFYSLWMLYAEEAELVRTRGLPALMELFSRNGVTELVEGGRRSVVY